MLQDFLPGLLEQDPQKWLDKAQEDPVGTLKELVGTGAEGIAGSLQRDVTRLLNDVPDDPTTIPNHVRSILCNTDNRPETLLELPGDIETTHNLVDQLCNLTVQQFTTFVEDFVQDLNRTSLFEQVWY